MKTLSNKLLFIVSTMVIGFFVFLYLNTYILKSNYPLISVVQELLTIPTLLIELCLFVFTIERINKNGILSDRYLLGSFVLLLLSIIFSFGPILISLFS